MRGGWGEVAEGGRDGRREGGREGGREREFVNPKYHAFRLSETVAKDLNAGMVVTLVVQGLLLFLSGKGLGFGVCRCLFVYLTILSPTTPPTPASRRNSSRYSQAHVPHAALGPPPSNLCLPRLEPLLRCLLWSTAPPPPKLVILACARLCSLASLSSF